LEYILSPPINRTRIELHRRGRAQIGHSTDLYILDSTGGGAQVPVVIRLKSYGACRLIFRL
jgi:hypothetical protein